MTVLRIFTRSALPAALLFGLPALVLGPPAGMSEAAASPGRAGASMADAARDAPGVTATPGAKLWLKRYNGPGNSNDAAKAVAVSPDGSKVFVTGTSHTEWTSNYLTTAYNAATGALLWTKSYSGPRNLGDAYALAVSPDGSRLFVTGRNVGLTSGDDYATVAYDTATGAQLWAKRYNGPGNGYDGASALAVSPDGSRLFVTGVSMGPTHVFDYATVAYSTATGAQLWTRRYDGPVNGEDAASALAVSPDGSKVFVTGYSWGSTGNADYLTIAYRASTGGQLWATRYNGPADDHDQPSALAVSPDGSRLFVTGYSSSPTDREIATVAYRATTGAELWAARYSGPAEPGGDEGRSVAVSPDGSRVFVTGYSWESVTATDYVTIAYTASTGGQLWAKGYGGPSIRDNEATAVAVSPDGSKVFVTGWSWWALGNADYATVAYRAATGAQLWNKRYDGTGTDWDGASALAVSPDGSKLFVTGSSWWRGSPDYLTIAYSITG